MKTKITPLFLLLLSQISFADDPARELTGDWSVQFGWRANPCEYNQTTVWTLKGDGSYVSNTGGAGTWATDPVTNHFKLQVETYNGTPVVPPTVYNSTKVSDQKMEGTSYSPSYGLRGCWRAVKKLKKRYD